MVIELLVQLGWGLDESRLQLCQQPGISALLLRVGLVSCSLSMQGVYGLVDFAELLT